MKRSQIILNLMLHYYDIITGITGDAEWSQQNSVLASKTTCPHLKHPNSHEKLKNITLYIDEYNVLHRRAILTTDYMINYTLVSLRFLDGHDMYYKTLICGYQKDRDIPPRGDTKCGKTRCSGEGFTLFDSVGGIYPYFVPTHEVIWENYTTLTFSDVIWTPYLKKRSMTLHDRHWLYWFDDNVTLLHRQDVKKFQDGVLNENNCHQLSSPGHVKPLLSESWCERNPKKKHFPSCTELSPVLSARDFSINP